MDTPIHVCSGTEKLGCQKNSFGPNTHTMLCNIITHFNAMRKNEATFDITIEVEGQNFKAHKDILKTSSPYFNTMFSYDLEENHTSKITFPNIAAKAIQIILDYIYTYQLPLNEGNVESVLSTAFLFQLWDVQRECSKYIQDRIQVNNCLGIMAFAQLYHCEDLYVEAKKYAETHFKKVIFEEEYLLVPLKQLTDLLSSDNIFVNLEAIVFQAAMKWIRHDLPKRHKHLLDVLQHIRFPLMPASYVVKIFRTENMIKDSLECRDLLDEAKDYYILRELKEKDWAPEIPNLKLKKRAEEKTAKEIIYVAGGFMEKEILSSVEKFDGFSWSLCSSMNTPRACLGTQILNGNLYAMGGYNNGYLSSVERYYPETDTWYCDVAPMPIARASFAVALDPVSKDIYVIGGHNSEVLANVERYSEKNNAWETCISLLQPRFGHCAIFFKNVLYVLGGENDECEILKSVEILSDNKWFYYSDMQKSRKHFGVVIGGDYLYALGGSEEDSSSIERFGSFSLIWTMYNSRLPKYIGINVISMEKSLYVKGNVKDRFEHLSRVNCISYNEKKYSNEMNFDSPDLFKMHNFFKSYEWEPGIPMNCSRLGSACSVMSPSEFFSGETGILTLLEVENAENYTKDAKNIEENEIQELVNDNNGLQENNENEPSITSTEVNGTNNDIGALPSCSNCFSLKSFLNTD